MDLSAFEPLWGEWKTEQLIGDGPSGTVYKIFREKDGDLEYAAVKHFSIPKSETEHMSIQNELGDDEDTITMFYRDQIRNVIREYEIQNSFADHPNFVHVYDFLDVPKRNHPGSDLFMRMELLENINRYFRHNPPGEEQIIQMGIDICSALEILHDQDYVHGNIKPQNIMVTPEGTFKLSNFSLIQKLRNDTTYLSQKAANDYMAPEIVFEQPFGVNVDLYSLGLVLYRYANGNTLPFEDRMSEKIVESALTMRLAGEKLPEPSNVSAGLAKVILKACEHKPKDRYQTAKEMRNALEALKGEDSARTDERVADHENTKPQQTTVKDVRDEPISKTKRVPGETTDKNTGKAKANIREGKETKGSSIGQSVKVGGYVTFGHYPQTKAGKDSSAIEWIILEAKNQEALLISRYALDCRPYENSYTSATWETSALRNWLKRIFINKAFTPEEKDAIVPATVENDRNQGNREWDSNGGKNTEDKVFLLSYVEAKKYFGNEDSRKCTLTEYALHKQKENTDVGWWLRSPGYSQRSAAYVREDGLLGDFNEVDGMFAVRPVLRVNMATVQQLQTSCNSSEPDRETKEIKTAERSEQPAGKCLNEVKVGSFVKFGHYPQTASGRDNTEIEWLILAKERNKVLLLSRYALDCQPYNSSSSGKRKVFFGTRVTWETCSLRNWLNETFIRKAFTTTEQGGIITTCVDNSQSQSGSQWNTSRGNNTQDKLFLLSYGEVNKYLKTYKARKCTLTDYALKQGGYTSSEIKMDGRPTGWWWLRSPGSSLSYAAGVDYGGGLGSDRRVSDLNYVVRPAMWVDIGLFA